MLKPERMSKMFVVGPKSKLDKMVAKLHELKIFHIIEHKKDEFDLCEPQESFEKVSSLLVQARSLTSHLNISSDKANVTFKIPELEKNLSNIKGEVIKIIDTTKKIEDELTLLSEQKNVLNLMRILKVSPEDFIESRYLKSYLGYVNDSIIKRKIR